jgi:hypothetical protein
MTEPTAYTVEHLRDAVARPPVAELGIEISIDAEGRVRLSGSVCSDEQRASVVEAVRREAPSAVVVDGLTVSHRPPDDTVEEVS